MVVFVLAPMILAFGALLTEAYALLVEIAAADKAGITVPGWLPDVPLIGLGSQPGGSTSSRTPAP